MTLLYATTNPGKLREAINNFAEYGYQVVGPQDLGINLDVDETGQSLEENAILKAEAYLPYLDDNTVVLADDTGMYIDALGGEPGIKVRRWLGYKMTDEEIINHTLTQLKNIPDSARTMEIKLALAIATKHHPTQVFVGSYRTHLLTEPKDFRDPGFPFRPLITAELPTHRTNAIKAALPYLSTLHSQNH